MKRLGFLACSFLLLLSVPAEARIITACDRVEILMPREVDSDLAEKMAGGLCADLQHLEKLFGLRLGPRLRVQVAVDMKDYRRRARRDWGIVAVWQEQGILTQPARSLRRIVDLREVLAHELVHGLVRRRCGRTCPRWLEEGLAVYLSGQRPQGRPPSNKAELAALENRLRAGRADRVQSQKDYGACRALVERLIQTVGREVLLGSLERFRDSKLGLGVKLGAGRSEVWLWKK
ncbi:MAG: hypothetical protein JRF33_03140 [Deltaproteobacteria bacterium]|nr:hypothetical protein [Deltaproteobacteria bacterium]